MKRILITGAGSGIGRAAAIELSKRGHLVYATTHTEGQSEKLRALAENYKLSLVSFKLDVLSKADREKLCHLKIDVLINNAALGDSGSASEVSVDKYRKTFETNVFSSLELTQLVLKDMIKRGKGRVIFISSLAGRITVPFLSPYTATKFAIEGIASSLRIEMKKLPKAKIQVGIIEPGAYYTGFNQKNIAKQFTWMYGDSYFKGRVKKLEKEQYRYFKLVEEKSLDSIVNQYIRAVEDKKLKHRYVKPKSQGAFIQLQRIFGK